MPVELLNFTSASSYRHLQYPLSLPLPHPCFSLPAALVGLQVLFAYALAQLANLAEPPSVPPQSRSCISARKPTDTGARELVTWDLPRLSSPRSWFQTSQHHPHHSRSVVGRS